MAPHPPTLSAAPGNPWRASITFADPEVGVVAGGGRLRLVGVREDGDARGLRRSFTSKYFR